MAEERRRQADRAEDMARDALNEIRTHEKVCTERYGTIVKNQDLGAVERITMHAANQASIRAIYSLLWKCALGIIGFQALILAGIVFAPK